MPPLALHAWYTLSVSLHGPQLRWSLNGTQGRVTLGHSGDYPARGQLAIGLVDYGLASIDDLVVDGVEGQ